jgi:hypothetical protein
MKEDLIIILGILDIVACVSLVIVHSSLDWYAYYAFTWGLPLLVAAIVALICGIFTLKRKSQAWAFTGLMIAGAAGIYFLILSWVVSWTMA